ncbi:glycosyl hydrolase 53 [Ascobolus immersus RN42]|uniref:Arabinogalactan endo-beta-1,4-galactanase n=1 Tax=Ascobolus immersus RN42 TaxID=1160509 RepID=A0A3N4ICK7_ASCIM|nr:glycosyl hydrolase 53 [Ascobolus immersus RN42]
MRYLSLLLALCLSTLSLALQWKTFDISSMLLEEEKNKIQYLDVNGNQQRLENILRNGGANSLKMRIWVNPSDGIYNLDYAVRLGRRIKDAGLPVVINLHYSDTWADPAHQSKPSAWAGLSTDALINQVRSYTTQVLNAFHSAGVTVNLVGIGNEIRGGMLFPTGSTSNFWDLARLLTAASQGVRQSNFGWNAKVMIHLDRGYSWGDQQWFYDSLRNNNFNMNDVDVLGVSYYPFWDAKNSQLENFQNTVNNMANRYGKQIVVVETGWPTQCSKASSNIPSSLTNQFQFTPAGQQQWVQRLAQIMNSVPNGRGAGIMYWEPGWVSNTVLGSPCEDGGVLFTADWSKWPNTIPTRAKASVNLFQGIY